MQIIASCGINGLKDKEAGDKSKVENKPDFAKLRQSVHGAEKVNRESVKNAPQSGGKKS